MALPARTSPPGDAHLSVLEKAKRKAIGVGGHGFFGSARLLHRLRRPLGVRLRTVDHVTIPCADLTIAERFYVGVLGARVVLRLDSARLQKMGWTAEQVVAENAAHLSLTISGGPRIELFEDSGVRDPDSPHPHLAFAVAPGKLLKWKQHLTNRGVTVVGPCRLGPPGQASCYFQDPFGNQLELATIGFITHDLPIGPPPRTGLGYDWPR